MRLSMGAWEPGNETMARMRVLLVPIPSHQSWNGHFKRMRTGQQILPGTYRGMLGPASPNCDTRA